EQVTIGNDHTETIDANRTRKVAGNMTTTGDGDQIDVVGISKPGAVAGNRILIVDHSFRQQLVTDDKVSVTNGALDESVGALIMEAAFQSDAIQASTAGFFTVGGAVAELALFDKTETAALGRIETVGGHVFSSSGKTTTYGISNRRFTTV